MGAPRAADAGEYLTVAEERLVWKLDLMICPIFFLINFASILDRSNIGNVFFVPYILFEIPSNLVVKCVRPSYYLSGLIFFWGIVVICEGFVNSYKSLIALRFLLGALEAGIFPGIAYVTSMYYKRFEYQRRLTVIWSSVILANAFGGRTDHPTLGSFWHTQSRISTAIMGMQLGDEGAITAFFGTIAVFWIPDWPEQNNYLSLADKEMVRQRLLSDQPAEEDNELDFHKLRAILFDWKIWISAFNAFGGIVTAYSMTLFLPTILNEFGWSAVEVQLHTIPVWAVAFLVALLVSWASDRLQHRSLFILALSVPPTIGYAILLRQDDFSRRAQYAATFLVVLGTPVVPVVFAWALNNLRGHWGRAVGSALINSVGNGGGIVAANVYLARASPRYYAGYGTALACVWLTGVGTIVMAVAMYLANRARRRAERNGLPETEQPHGTGHALEYTL
ncbi:hypothetical protein PG994_005814 [Apiospora phragmitis]|uniref:MFS general substrate transporter n=1 Tax=Apiospora phragmitis TaxID=2905665 RepID=A0ABR1VH29_9PEZI